MEEKYAALREAVEKVEIVDAHAHNIVALHSTVPFLNCFSEATGDALSFAPHTLSFKRCLRDVSELYGSESSLHGVEQYRNSTGLERISATCFQAARISTLLIDDGIEADKKLDIEWHCKYVPNTGRILRIERLAEQILDDGSADGITWTLDIFTRIFLGNGLKINTNVTVKEAQDGLADVLRAGTPVHIMNKHLIDYIFMRSLEVALSFDLPVQIHTGFGDKDLDLRLCNPLHLRSVLEDERYSKCRIVLLHASYPFSKEASYLASVYSQVFLDFGLAVPKLSVHGMITSVKELLELAPIKKVMFSTDACMFPESFYLGSKKAREVVFSVLRDACADGDLSNSEALEAVKDIFADNAKQFYKLDAAAKFVISANGASDHSSKLANEILDVVESNAKHYNLNASVNQINLENGTCPHSMKVATQSSEQDVSFVRIIWVDTSGQHRCRVVQRKRFHDFVKTNGVGLTFASMAMTSAADGPADGTNLSGVGEIRLLPDLSTKCRIPWAKQEEMVLADMYLRPGEAWEYCPREALRRVLKVLKEEFNLEVNAGFENEFFLLKKVSSEGKEDWVPFDTSSYCSTSAFDVASPILYEIIAALESLNIPVDQLHAESGNGQYEIVMGYTACSEAADNLIFTREAIRAVARKHGLLATFVPKYALGEIGSGSHVHISLSQNGKNVFMASDEHSHYGMSKVGEEFMSGVLNHLPSILAFTAPIPNSYDRLQPHMWSGAYLCWGKENKEAPLRTACPPGIPDGLVSNFEIKAIDGCANPYLALSSIIASGIDGLRRHLNLPEPINEDPQDGKLQRLPQSLSESVDALEKDSALEKLIGEKLLLAVKGVRKAEINYYSQNKDAYKNLIYRY
ncbi:Glutamate-ammonia ligase [Heracleum sosnowskyi]|uniref:Glutamate-ammonia ligase n=1 Tax=Heracleum sosnowskyi TaxID=360622 RepID=A0AAD8NCI5_9APIA|nr:Glutamate-ammonia ligase [Heracleum sosnowskyi]